MTGGVVVLGIVLILVSFFLWGTTLVIKRPKRTLEQHQARLYELLSVFQSICRDFDVRPWAAFGTFLGAVREGGIIPWDDDIDMEILPADYHRLLANEALIQEKYGVRLSDPLWKMTNALRVRFLNDNTATIDVFLTRIDHKTGRMVQDNSLFPTYFHKGGRPELVRVPFGPQSILVPKSKHALVSYYGEDWQTPQKRFSHNYWIGYRPPLQAVMIPCLTFGTALLLSVLILVWGLCWTREV